MGSLWAAAIIGSWCNFITMLYIGEKIFYMGIYSSIVSIILASSLESDSLVPVSILMAALISYEISITDPDNELNLGKHNVFHVTYQGQRMINTYTVPSIIKS